MFSLEDVKKALEVAESDIREEVIAQKWGRRFLRN